jgi:hypothetical protein
VSYMSGDGWLGKAQHQFGEVGGRLEALCLFCVQSSGADGAGLTVVTADGVPETVYATDPLSARLEDIQFTLGEGPSVDATRSGIPVLVPSLDATTWQEWPAFGKEAASAGAAAVFAFPIRIGAVSFGVLDLHRRTSGSLSRDQLAQALTAGDQAAQLLMAVTAEGLDGAMPESTYRMVVHQAAGMGMVQMGTTIEEAMLSLRAIAYAEDLPINDLAADVVAGRRRLSKEKP